MKGKREAGQTIAITLMITMLMLLLSAAVVTSVVNNMREAGQSKSKVTLDSAAEVGLDMAERDITRAAELMTQLIWSHRFDSISPSTTFTHYAAPVTVTDNPDKNHISLKVFEYFSDLRNWPGFSANDGWGTLPTASVYDRFYDFDQNGSVDTASEIIGESVSDKTLSGGKLRHFFTQNWKKGGVFDGNDTAANMSKRYKFMLYRPANISTQSCTGLYNDLMPVKYVNNDNSDGMNPSLPGYAPIFKKVYTFSDGNNPIRVAVYVRMLLDDYLSFKVNENGHYGNPDCKCGTNGVAYHDSIDPSSDRYIGRCPENKVKFLIAAVSESTPDAPSRTSGRNVTVSMGGAVLIQKPPYSKLTSINGSALTTLVLSTALADGGYKHDPGCFAPVLDKLVAPDPGANAKGATVSGTVVPVGPVGAADPLVTQGRWFDNGRVYLYAEAQATDGQAKKRWYGPKEAGAEGPTTFLVGWDAAIGKYRFWYFGGKKPDAGAFAQDVAPFFWKEAYNFPFPFNDDLIVNKDNTDLKWDLRDVNGNVVVDEDNLAYPTLRQGRTEVQDLADVPNDLNKPFSLKHASGYYSKVGPNLWRFFVKRKFGVTEVGYTPEATGFTYFVSAHFLAVPVSVLPGRLSLKIDKVSSDSVLTGD